VCGVCSCKINLVMRGSDLGEELEEAAELLVVQCSEPARFTPV
jgi:hypothetical protein